MEYYLVVKNILLFLTAQTSVRLNGKCLALCSVIVYRNSMLGTNSIAVARFKERVGAEEPGGHFVRKPSGAPVVAHCTSSLGWPLSSPKT